MRTPKPPSRRAACIPPDRVELSKAGRRARRGACRAQDLHRRAAERGIPPHDDALLACTAQTRSEADLDAFVKVLASALKQASRLPTDPNRGSPPSTRRAKPHRQRRGLFPARCMRWRSRRLHRAPKSSRKFAHFDVLRRETTRRILRRHNARICAASLGSLCFACFDQHASAIHGEHHRCRGSRAVLGFQRIAIAPRYFLVRVCIASTLAKALPVAPGGAGSRKKKLRGVVDTLKNRD